MMADYFPGEISMGGEISRKRAEQLARKMREAGLSHAWGDATIKGTVEELVDLTQNLLGAGEATGVVWACLDQARFGMFEDLEEWLVKHRIPFDRRSDARYEFSAEMRRYRPGLGDFTLPMCGEKVVVDADKVREALGLLKARRLDAGNLSATVADPQAIAILEELLGPEIPPLPPFRIVESRRPRDEKTPR